MRRKTSSQFISGQKPQILVLIVLIVCFLVFIYLFMCVFMKGAVKSSFWDIGADVRCSVGRCVSVFFCPSFL